MKKIFLIGIIALLIYTGISHPKEVIIPIQQIFEQASLYDGKEVVVKGEIIGDIMKDGDYFWINIKDRDSFIGVVIDSFQREQIGYTGRYNVRGDIVKIKGIYHVQCPLHYGERDIHCEQIEILESGYTISETIKLDRVITLVSLGIITIFVLIYAHRQNVHRDTTYQQKKI